MSGPKPALGYPSRTAAILALRAEDVSTDVIAARLGITPSTVTALEVSAARTRKRSAAGDGRAILIPDSALRGLRRAAAKRGMTPHELARVIVVTVADNNLIDAVLDDEDDPPANLFDAVKARGL